MISLPFYPRFCAAPSSAQRISQAGRRLTGLSCFDSSAGVDSNTIPWPGTLFTGMLRKQRKRGIRLWATGRSRSEPSTEPASSAHPMRMTIQVELFPLSPVYCEASSLPRRGPLRRRGDRTPLRPPRRERSIRQQMADRDPMAVDRSQVELAHLPRLVLHFRDQVGTFGFEVVVVAVGVGHP